MNRLGEKTNRILVLGICGAGKSTLSAALGEIFDLPVVHLDRHYWQPGWKEPSLEEWRKTVVSLAEEPRWIMDGNYSDTLDLRIPLADQILYLDFPRWRCLYRVHKRWLTYRKDARPDMGPGCSERMEWEFLRFIWNFPRDIRPRVMKMIRDYGKEDLLVVLKTPMETARYIAGIRRVAEPRR